MNKLISWLFPLLIAALILCGTSIYPLIFNGTSRWILVLAAFLLTMFSPYTRIVRKTPLFRVLYLYLLWCSITVIWSEIQVLSLYKVIALIMVTIGLFSLGFSWVMSKDSLHETLFAFKWVVGSSLLVAISGRVGQGLLEQGTDYYKGLTGNPNYLGWMMAASIPVVLWYAFDRSKKDYHRAISFFLLSVCTYYLLIAQSRASMLLVLFTIVGFFTASDLGKRARLSGTIIFVVVAAILTVPNISELAYNKYLLKSQAPTLAGSFEASRKGIFENSYAAAIEGGTFGGGVGISIGSSPYRYYGGWSSVGYGREKGNSGLAVIEETGGIGLGIVLWLYYILFSTSRRAYRKARAREDRLLVGTLTGFLFGFLVHSNFEAWWVSPGSAESMFFWGLAGLSYAVYKRLDGTYEPKKLT